MVPHAERLPAAIGGRVDGETGDRDSGQRLLRLYSERILIFSIRIVQMDAIYAFVLCKWPPCLRHSLGWVASRHLRAFYLILLRLQSVTNGRRTSGRTVLEIRRCRCTAKTSHSGGSQAQRHGVVVVVAAAAVAFDELTSLTGVLLAKRCCSRSLSIRKNSGGFSASCVRCILLKLDLPHARRENQLTRFLFWSRAFLLLSLAGSPGTENGMVGKLMATLMPHFPIFQFRWLFSLSQALQLHVVQNSVVNIAPLLPSIRRFTGHKKEPPHPTMLASVLLRQGGLLRCISFRTVMKQTPRCWSTSSRLPARKCTNNFITFIFLI